ncbi:hypothetical protein [Nocardia brasiliensis]|uniref:hypothetical protein n=1 Tax=Nocardia brasiliensis TaxID=37326 RepID=UPI0024571C57|nr:hypothetical protein [Nocardia brasiliensis]
MYSIYEERALRAYVAREFKIQNGDPVTIEIDNDGKDFAGTVCDRTGEAAAVHILYWRNTGSVLEPEWSEVKPNYNWDTARDEIAALIADPQVDHHNGIAVWVNAWFLVFGLKVAA